MKMHSDKYLNNPEKVDELEKMGIDVTPIDLNGHFVPTDKSVENLEEMQESIQEDFCLGGEK